MQVTCSTPCSWPCQQLLQCPVWHGWCWAWQWAVGWYCQPSAAWNELSGCSPAEAKRFHPDVQGAPLTAAACCSKSQPPKRGESQECTVDLKPGSSLIKNVFVSFHFFFSCIQLNQIRCAHVYKQPFVSACWWPKTERAVFNKLLKSCNPGSSSNGYDYHVQICL